jgi:hypothetical protein
MHALISHSWLPLARPVGSARPNANFLFQLSMTVPRHHLWAQASTGKA